jgi:hypothetical protein
MKTGPDHPFTLFGVTYRLVKLWSHEWEHGYAEPALIADNLLQRLRWWGWQTVARERIPTHVWISAATLGDTGGWISDLVRRVEAILELAKGEGAS